MLEWGKFVSKNILQKNINKIQFSSLVGGQCLHRNSGQVQPQFKWSGWEWGCWGWGCSQGRSRKNTPLAKRSSFVWGSIKIMISILICLQILLIPSGRTCKKQTHVLNRQGWTFLTNASFFYFPHFANSAACSSRNLNPFHSPPDSVVPIDIH